MDSTNIEIRIPAAIAALPLPIGEKIVLAHIAKFPGCSNARLAELIGGTRRGVESLLRRLRQQNYIEQSGNGRARRHRLLFHVEHHILCDDGNVVAIEAKSHIARGDNASVSSAQPESMVPVLDRELSWEDELDQTLAIIHELCVNYDPFPEAIVNFYERILKRVANEAPDGAVKDTLVRELTMRRDAFYAISYAQRAPRKYHRQADRLISAATPEKLAEFRQRALSEQLDGKDHLLLTILGGRTASGNDFTA